MELLPILSTIILVGTIATLILAVAAYVLYKVRERQGRRPAAAPPPTPPSPLLLTAPAASTDPTQVAQLQELLRLAVAGLQQQGAPNALLAPPSAPPAWSPPQADAPAPFEEATFEDVTPLRPDDLSSYFGSTRVAPPRPEPSSPGGSASPNPYDDVTPEDLAESLAAASEARSTEAGKPTATPPEDPAPHGDGRSDDAVFADASLRAEPRDDSELGHAEFEDIVRDEPVAPPTAPAAAEVIEPEVVEAEEVEPEAFARPSSVAGRFPDVVSGDGAPTARDARYDELMRLADELDDLFDGMPPRRPGSA